MAADAKMTERYFEAVINIPRDMQVPVCNYIIENISGGIVLAEEDDSDEVGIRFYVPEEKGEHFRNQLSDYLNVINTRTITKPENIRTKLIANIEWEQAYKDSIRPIVIDNVVVRPPWIVSPYKDKMELIIEPKMAFGTGSHETTKLCIREIQKYFKEGQTLFDLGCGSGILSILAAKMGASAVKGVDVDLIAVQNSRENISINRVEDRINIEFGSIEKAEEGTRYDFLVANLIKSSILELYGRLEAIVKPGGILLLSGLLIQDREAMDELLTGCQVSRREINQDGQWLSYTIWKK